MKGRTNKAQVNYFVDIVIAVGFLISAATGILLVFAPSGGYRGGHGPGALAEILGQSIHWWKSLHTWSSMLMAAGVLAHLVLHTKWISCMTRNLFRKNRKTIACEA